MGVGCKNFGTFLAKKVPETNVEKSIRWTQNPCTFALRFRRVPLPNLRGHSVILTSSTGYRLLTAPTNFLPQTLLIKCSCSDGSTVLVLQTRKY
ncbi:MAG: hypothetical protein EWV85_01060 [Microcystis aeruginosa Ma_QC_C_20070703_M131]|uniref:Uncharacterized protein n=1 Tax=Microcystis aeruginosa Ma_QC_C_20070703_M131 TaxID=2486263 RepID=A0A551YMG9_MICAE|nr:MAG: hypothetical protein EWV85_01060 [Microcystis aeruginosa Ma_QC_C_20070703_M131]